MLARVNCRETETQGGSRMGRGEAVELESQLPGPGMVETQTDDGGGGTMTSDSRNRGHL